MMGVFGTQKLQDEVFCLTQERDFFQSRYLEQVSQIQDMKQEMESYRKEINRLRLELLNQSAHACSLQDKITEDMTLRSMTIVAGFNSPENESGTASKAKDEEEDGDESDVEGNTEEDAEALDIRQNAAKLLQWADYRTTARTSPAKETKDVDEDSATESYSESDRSAASVEY